jgi:hypothetical protein
MWINGVNRYALIILLIYFHLLLISSRFLLANIIFLLVQVCVRNKLIEVAVNVSSPRPAGYAFL